MAETLKYLAWMNSTTPPPGAKVSYWFNPTTSEWKKLDGTEWVATDIQNTWTNDVTFNGKIFAGEHKGQSEVVQLAEGKMTFRKGLLTKWEPV
jgi:hypothetical protein